MAEDQEILADIARLLEAEPSSSGESEIIARGPDIPALREQLPLLVSAGKAKEASGVMLTHENLKRLANKEVEKYSKRYQTYVGSKTTESLIDSCIFLVTKAVGIAVDIKDVSAFQRDLKNDNIINNQGFFPFRQPYFKVQPVTCISQCGTDNHKTPRLFPL